MTTLDNRYPWMLPAERVSPELARLAREVRNRTGCHCFWHSGHDYVVFCWRDDPSFGVPVPASAIGQSGDWLRLQRPDGTWRPVESHETDRIVNWLWKQSKATRRQKDRDGANRVRMEEHDRTEQHERDFESRRNDVERAVNRSFSRQGMGKHYRPSALVSGLRSNA